MLYNGNKFKTVTDCLQGIFYGNGKQSKMIYKITFLSSEKRTDHSDTSLLSFRGLTFSWSSLPPPHVAVRSQYPRTPCSPPLSSILDYHYLTGQLSYVLVTEDERKKAGSRIILRVGSSIDLPGGLGVPPLPSSLYSM